MSNLRQLATASGIPLTTLWRLREQGVIPHGDYDIPATIQVLMRHYREREKWAFMMLRMYGLFDVRADAVTFPGDRR